LATNIQTSTKPKKHTKAYKLTKADLKRIGDACLQALIEVGIAEHVSIDLIFKPGTIFPKGMPLGVTTDRAYGLGETHRTIRVWRLYKWLYENGHVPMSLQEVSLHKKSVVSRFNMLMQKLNINELDVDICQEDVYHNEIKLEEE
jgi:hypothetical protein